MWLIKKIIWPPKERVTQSIVFTRNCLCVLEYVVGNMFCNSTVTWVNNLVVPEFGHNQSCLYCQESMQRTRNFHITRNRNGMAVLYIDILKMRWFSPNLNTFKKYLFWKFVHFHENSNIFIIFFKIWDFLISNFFLTPIIDDKTIEKSLF